MNVRVNGNATWTTCNTVDGLSPSLLVDAQSKTHLYLKVFGIEPIPAAPRPREQDKPWQKIDGWMQEKLG